MDNEEGPVLDYGPVELGPLELHEEVIDFNRWYPNYDQFAAFGVPSDDPERSDTARTIKPLLDATHESLSLMVSAIESASMLLRRMCEASPAVMSDVGTGELSDVRTNELSELASTVSRLRETFALINQETNIETKED